MALTTLLLTAYIRTNQEHSIYQGNAMLGELNFHSKPRWSDWAGSTVILGTIIFATTLLMAV
jgi:uncharacterized membrane protein YgdD (TMEM256/DUF423 family)